MKKNIFKILLYLSFLPFLSILCYGGYNAIMGYDIYSMFTHTYVRTIYGMEGFMETFFRLGLNIYLLLIACLIYQIIYLILHLLSKKG